ncbi:MAG: class I SAM-dependent methyltransferase [Chloroflexi bacterium]|nr:MAG: class I SAM-dependent methyltransferase [Chloroflexota bacterium]
MLAALAKARHRKRHELGIFSSMHRMQPAEGQGAILVDWVASIKVCMAIADAAEAAPRAPCTNLLERCHGRVTLENRAGLWRSQARGFFGIDIAPGGAVDLVLDVEKERLPFADGSVEYIYSSHTFEHLERPGSPIPTLREIVRVARHGATVEIWTPYGKSNDALLLGHRNFYTETHWQHICFLYDEFYLGKGPGRFVWEKSQYVLTHGCMEELARVGITIDFALKYMYNGALEFGVFLKVDKTLTKGPSTVPVREFGYERGQLLQPPALAGSVPIPPSAPRPEHDLRSILSRDLKKHFPRIHALAGPPTGH